MNARAFLLLSLAPLLGSCAGATTRPQTEDLPERVQTSIWQAETATLKGWRAVPHPWAAGGAYVEAADEGATLEFRFKADRPTTLQVWPRWWRHGEEKAATRFPQNILPFQVPQTWPLAYPNSRASTLLPFPLTGRPGPEVIDAFGAKLFFTAPETGRVGVVDLNEERLVGSVDVGGHVTDLVVDREAKRVYVSDGSGNRVVALDAETHEKRGEAQVPALPRSISLSKGRLFVASMRDKVLTVLDLPSLTVSRKVALPVAPQHVEAREGKATVWFLPGTYDPGTFSEHPPDRLAYWPSHPFPRNPAPPPLPWTTLRALKQGHAVPLRDHSFTLFGYHEVASKGSLSRGPDGKTFRIRYAGEKADEIVDFSEAAPGDGDAYPDRYCVISGTLFFTSPSAGQVGFLPLRPGAKVGVIPVGGRLADMAGFTGQVLGKYVDQDNCFLHSEAAGAAYSSTHRHYPPRLYVADAENRRIVVLDPMSRKVLHEIALGSRPVALTTYGLEVFAACRERNEVVVWEVFKDQVLRRHALPAEPVLFDVAKLQPKHTSTEFTPPPEVDESPLRALFHYRPAAFDERTLAPAPPSPFDLSDMVLYRRRSELRWADGSRAEAKRVFVDNLHLVRIEADRWVNVSAVTDRARLPEPSRLNPGDTPGTLTVSVDGGPEHDWTRAIWLEPDTRRFLVSGTEDFRRTNAPAFSVGPGEHVLRIKAGSRFARLDAIDVWRTLERRVEAALAPHPQEDHRAGYPSYAGVFASGEPVRYTLDLKSLADTDQSLEVRWRLTHPLTGTVSEGREAAELKSRGNARFLLSLRSGPTGLLELEAEVVSADGSIGLRQRLLKLPPLSDHPRLLFRAEESEAIRQRIAKYPTLFKRYRSWLLRHKHEPGFLPADFRRAGRDQEVDLARWRAIAALFSDRFLSEDGSRPFLEWLDPHLKGPGSSHPFQWDFQFGSALAIVYDLAASLSPRVKERMNGQLLPVVRDPNALPELMAYVEEPLTELDRAALGWQAVTLGNYLTYFRTHAGTLGGLLWQGLRSDCQCPLHAIARTFILYRNFLNDRSLLEEKIWPGYYTYQNYGMPAYDRQPFLSHGGVRGGGEQPAVGNLPMRIAITSLCRNPLERLRNDLDPLVAKLNGPLDDTEAEKLLSHEANGIVPLFLALGWYAHDSDEAESVAREELPPGLLFDVEGAASMRSDWTPNTTDVYFVSGVRDVVYRTQPNHLQIFKAGRVLLGTPVHEFDHGSPTSSWGNAVVVGEGLPKEWASATGYARMEERIVINRSAPDVLGYVFRDFRLRGIEPPGGWFNGGHSGPGVFDLILHSHSRHPFLSQGQIAAYETHPSFDYVAGDATNVWPLEDVREIYRQVVFVRPDVLVVFDRVEVGDALPPTRWLASTAPDLRVRDTMFTISNQDAWLAGSVLLPEGARLKAGKARAVGNRPFEGGTILANELEVFPPDHVKRPRYLTVLRVGTGPVEALDAVLIQEPGRVLTRFSYCGSDVEVRFRTEGPVGGHVRIQGGGRALARDLVERVDLSLRHWKDDPRFEKWTTERRFRHFVPPADRR